MRDEPCGLLLATDRLHPRAQGGYTGDMNKRTLGVGAVFLVGCAVGGVSSQLVVPRASAQQAATLTRWEYTCIDTMDATALNQYGAQAWELAATTVDPSNGTKAVCLKRPKKM